MAKIATINNKIKIKGTANFSNYAKGWREQYLGRITRMRSAMGIRVIG